MRSPRCRCSPNPCLMPATRTGTAGCTALTAPRLSVAGFSQVASASSRASEPLALLALAGLVDSRLKGFDCELVAAACGVNRDDLREIAEGFGKAKKGVVIGAIGSGRTDGPGLFSLALQLLVSRMKGSKKLLIAAEAAVPPGPRRFSEILAAIESGEVKNPHELRRRLSQGLPRTGRAPGPAGSAGDNGNHETRAAYSGLGSAGADEPGERRHG